QGQVEQAIAAIWAELLGTGAITRDQSFFALGGDSLLATRLIEKMGDAGIAGGDLRNLFASPRLKDFAALLTLGQAASAVGPVIADPAHRHEPFPATDVQYAYWVGRAADFALGGVGSHWYWEFDGAGVDLDRIEEAWNHLIERHEMLRAVFCPDGRQSIVPQVPRYEIAVTDVGLEQAGSVLAGLRESMSHRVPDPSRWPLIEIRAVRYGGNRTRLAFSFDYIVVDALSILLLFAELSDLYRDIDAALPPIRLSFRDYVLAAQPGPGQIAAARQHWLERLEDLPSAPQLPLREDPARVVSPRFTRWEARLRPEKWHAITGKARALDLTPAAVLATVFAEVLSAWSARPELTLNLTLFHRRRVHPDIDRVLGDFTSLVLAAFTPQAGENWTDSARRFQQQIWSGMEHSAVSAIWVMRELARRSAGPAGSMPVVFTSALGMPDELVNMSMPFGEQVWGLSQTPQVWLDCQVTERGGGLFVNWDAVEDLFPAGVLDGMFGAFTGLLDWLADGDWGEPVGSLLPASQARVRAAVNAVRGAESGRLLHAGFFGWAASEPGRLALAWGEDGRLSYGELAGWALRVGALLVARGVVPGELVGVTAAKGPGQVAAVLGVLAAGGVYVPVGVDQPMARRAAMYADAGVRFVVAGAAESSALEWPEGVEVVAVDGPAAAAAAPLAVPVPVDREQLAYVIYTSGSTGAPKGVMVSHRSAVNTVEDVSGRFAVREGDRVLAVSALDFDLSVYDMFGLLGAGGAVVLVGEDERRDARCWAELVRRWRVTVWNSVPALLDMLLVAAGDRGLGDGLRLALVSGDWVGLDLPGRLAAACPGCRLIALGGATEAAIWSNAFEVGEVPGHWRSVPYGYPLRNQMFRVVDARGRDCPDWVPGELWIGGTGVARGYWRDAERTTRQFVPGEDGRRWYRTGDLGRYWPDGTLEFLGRADFQVKIRGHRIELGEIEAALQAHPQIARAAVCVVTGPGPGAGTRRLAAAVVPREPGAGPDPAALREFLDSRLPGYMVPDWAETVSALPLSGNGKVDRTAIAQLLDCTARPAAASGQPPQGQVEQAIAAIWAELLGTGAITRDQSFFALGGDSLLATRLIEVIRVRLGAEISLRDLLDAATLTELAGLAVAHGADTGAFELEEGVL
ncbi:MAG: amino acid adenylation domain-containing protein, partial [Streptosporangiaceae bacterium]